MLKRFKNYLLEMAIPLSKYKEVMKKVENWSPKEKYFEIFSHYDTGPRKNKKPYRIYFPLKSALSKQDLKIKVLSDVNELNVLFSLAYDKKYINNLYKVENYILGIAIDKSEKRIIKIGKLLNQILKKAEKDNDHTAAIYIRRVKSALKNFEQNSIRKKNKNDYYVVISHHPYDVAGMSTNRGWTSCMDLYGGEKSHYVLSDIKEGSIIAYFVKSNDLNIENPTGRILIKPYVNVNNKKEFILLPGPEYGTVTIKMRKFVEEWCDEINRKFLGFKKTTLYCLNPRLYKDNQDKSIYIENVDKITENEITQEFLAMLENDIFAIWHNNYYEIIAKILSNPKISMDKCYEILSFTTKKHAVDIHDRNVRVFETMMNLDRAKELIEYIFRKKRLKEDFGIYTHATVKTYNRYVQDFAFFLRLLDKYNYNEIENNQRIFAGGDIFYAWFLEIIRKKKITSDEFWKYLKFFDLLNEDFWSTIVNSRLYYSIWETQIPKEYYGVLIKGFNDLINSDFMNYHVITMIEKHNPDFLKTVKQVDESLFNMIYIEVYYNERLKELREIIEKKFSKKELEKIIGDEDEEF